MGRPLGLVLLTLISGVTAIVMAYGAVGAADAGFAWRNVVLLALMVVTVIASIVNTLALWRRSAGAMRHFIVWYTALALTVISTNLYLEWSWARLSNLVVQLGLAAVIGIVLARYVRSQLSPSAAGRAPV